ncbi:MAG TPA: hypothetical protein VGS19_05510 [Streptosporangiaceae bacterium]|nr:hypothetical protein [Streptosporangiaceae bacterium]
MGHLMRKVTTKLTLLAAAATVPLVVAAAPATGATTGTAHHATSRAGHSRQSAHQAVIYGGGPFYNGGTAVMNSLRNSGFTTVVLWTIHVHSNGDLYYNNSLVVHNGQYVGHSAWPGQLATLLQQPTSVNRIEVSVGSAGVNDWGTIDQLISSQGTGTGSILYKNFSALRTVTGAVAVNSDDEEDYNLSGAEAFAHMVLGMGYSSFTIVPFTNQGYWAQLKSNLGSKLDRVYLQDYAGGTGNSPSQWSQALGITVMPGLWSRNGTGCTSGDSPKEVQKQMAAWVSSAHITGGFMWLYDDIRQCARDGNAYDYAHAILNGLNGIS